MMIVLTDMYLTRNVELYLKFKEITFIYFNATQRPIHVSINIITICASILRNDDGIDEHLCIRNELLVELIQN